MFKPVKPEWPFSLNRDSRQAIGLVGWWPGDVMPGSFYWHEYTGRGAYRGFMTGFPTPFSQASGWAAGKDKGRGATIFNGGQVVTATTPLPFTNTAYSVSFWANWVTTGTTTATIQALIDNNHGSGTGFVLQDRPDLAKVLTFYTGNTGGADVESTFQVGDGTWRHIVCTYDGATSTGKMYIDGKLNATNSSMGTHGVIQANLTWGKWQGGSRFLTGRLEDARAYNRVLSASDVWAMFDPRTRWELRYQLPSKARGIIRSPSIPESISNSLSLTGAVNFNQVFNRPASNSIAFVEKIPMYPRNLIETITFVGTAVNLNNIYNKSLSEALTYVSTATPDVLRRSSQSLSLTQVVGIQFDDAEIVPQSVALVSAVGRQINYVRSLPQSLALSQAVDADKSHLEVFLQTLTFTQLATYTTIRSLPQSLTLSQSVVGGKIFNRSLTSTMTLSQDETDVPSRKTVSQAITLSQAVVENAVYDREFSQTLTLNSVVNETHLRLASNTITFSDLATANVYNGTYGTLSLTQEVDVIGVYNKNANFSILTLSQTVVGAANRSLSASNTLTIAEAVIPTHVQFFSVANTFAPHDNAIPIRILNVSATLTFSQTVVKSRVITLSVGNGFGVAEVLARNVVYNRAFTDIYPVVNGQSRPVNIQGRPGYTYVPSTVDPSSPAVFQYVAIPGAVITKVEEFVTYAVPGRILYLDQPEFGDTEANLHKIVEHRTCSGKLYTHVRRFPARALKYKYGISRAKVEEVREFILSYLSTPMYMTNWKGEIWYGFITNNPFKLTSKGRSMPCNIEDFEIDIEFEGVRIH